MPKCIDCHRTHSSMTYICMNAHWVLFIRRPSNSASPGSFRPGRRKGPQLRDVSYQLPSSTTTSETWCDDEAGQKFGAAVLARLQTTTRLTLVIPLSGLHDCSIFHLAIIAGQYRTAQLCLSLIMSRIASPGWRATPQHGWRSHNIQGFIAP